MNLFNIGITQQLKYMEMINSLCNVKLVFLQETSLFKEIQKIRGKLNMEVTQWFMVKKKMVQLEEFHIQNLDSQVNKDC